MIEQMSRCRQSTHSRAALTVLLTRSCRTASLRKQSMSGEAQLVQVAGLEPAEPATTISVPGTAPLTVDAIFRLLRDEILHGVLPPGAVVSQVSSRNVLASTGHHCAKRFECCNGKT